MKQGLSQPNNSSVFEMILGTVGSEPTAVNARPSDFQLPDNWHEDHQEGQLAVDVGQTDKDVVIVSTMAGADAEKIEVYVHNDLLTIRGYRVSPVSHEVNEGYFHEECFWGKFSRTVVLPVEVKGDLAKAEYKNGVLVVKIPKHQTDARVPITIVED